MYLGGMLHNYFYGGFINMKRFLSLLLIMVLVTSFGYGSKKAPKPKKGAKPAAEVVSTAKGYKIDGNKVTFMFNPKDYPEGFDETEMVTVAGEFNGWDAGAKDWQAVLNAKDGIWYFESTKDVVPSETKFKFVVNTVDWQQPDPAKVPKENLVDDGYGGFNLVVLY